MPRKRRKDRPPFDQQGCADVLERQDGLISASQLTALHATDGDVQRMLRSRDLVRVRRGVYVNHTGKLTAGQRDWAALLAVPGSVLADESALAAARRGRKEELGATDAVVHVAVPSTSNVGAPDAIRVHYVAHLQDHALTNASPPRMRPELAALRVAGRAADDVAAVGVLTDVLNRHLTTAARLQSTLARLPRCRRRGWLRAVVDDLASGTCSVLEHGYLVQVERAHGLPPPSRQSTRQGADGTEYRDVEYDEYGLVVELDGKTFHEGSAARDKDYERDLDEVVAGHESVRLTWGQVFRRSCRTAGKVAVVLQRHGWSGAPVPCGDSCDLAA
jgi:hypothetical protein